MRSLYTTRGIYQLRKANTKSNGKDGVCHYSIGVPRELGERLYGRRFQIELTEEGILYRPVNGESPPDLDLPEWAQ